MFTQFKANMIISWLRYITLRYHLLVLSYTEGLDVKLHIYGTAYGFIITYWVYYYTIST